MAEYVDREALLRIAEQQGHVSVDDILNEPVVDVEQVTRCKDCYQSVVIGEVLHCTYWSKDTDENGYCHEGG